MAKLPKSLLIAVSFFIYFEQVYGDSLVAPTQDAARFAPEPTRRRPASIQPMVDEAEDDATTSAADLDEKDEETEAAWTLPAGYQGGPGCENCDDGLRTITLRKIPLDLIQPGGQ